MVVPVTSEAEWMSTVQAAAPWHPPVCANAWVIAPHPDDETLATGGLIARLTQCGAKVSVIAVTDGENAYQHNEGLAALRSREQEAALHRLGIKPDGIHRLRFPDSAVSKSEDSLRLMLSGLIGPGSLVLAPWTGDFHPDHEACGRAAQEACEQVGATSVSYFFWTWHRGRPDLLKGTGLRRVSLSPQEREAKLDALSAHRSQLTACGDEPPILPEDLLWPARMACEVYLP